MATYIHELKDRPQFTWDASKITQKLAAVRNHQGRLAGRMEELGFKLKTEANLEALTEEVIKSSEIEGEVLNREQVRSSLARRLGVDIGALTPSERNVEGIVEMMLDATGQYDAPLTSKRLFGWHAALFPTGHSGMTKITVANWRTDASGPMQVVSGPIGRERVHYEAPKAALLADAMKAFINWFNDTQDIDSVLKAAIAQLWFVTIHPFEDGNGRIARAIAHMALARSENSSQCFYSMSAQIRQERNAYYDILEAAQKGDLDITEWLEWFLDCLDRAFDRADTILASVLRKARFWKKHADQTFNDRQRAMIERLFEGFKGKLTSSKWAQLTKSSQDTALRDIDDLVAKRVLTKDAAGGRSTSYSLITEDTTSSG
ncbi:Fic family protein [Bradyrhizobium genosp. P]|uniref:Fic family protein n=1 Tax=Bradyrhizobium genosp. P TaxID=83641 RepID=UPI003CF9D91B